MKREPLWLILIYCVAHTPLLFTTGRFFDDLPFQAGNADLVLKILWATGRPLYGYYVNFVMGLNSDLVPRLLAFFAYLLSALLLRATLKSTRLVDDEARFFLVALFMVFPADSTKVALMLVYYSLSYLLFFLGVWCLSRYLMGRGVLWRIMSLTWFFLSFFVPSLLVLFALVFLLIAYVERDRLRTMRSAMMVMFGYGDFLVLPLVFWLARALFFPPTGWYAGYYGFHMELISPVWWAVAIRGALVRPILSSLTPVHVAQVAAVVGGSCLLWWIWRKSLPEPRQNLKSEIFLFAAGVLAFFLALLPYVAIGKLPDFWDWSGRHALLVPLGVAFILYYGLRIFGQLTKLRRSVTLFMLCFLLCAFTSATVMAYSNYWVDWYKCLALVQQFKASDVMRDHSSFLFVDEAADWNAKKRKLRFYEYAGLMEMAFGDQRRFGVLAQEWSGQKSLDEIESMMRGQDFNPSMPGMARFYCIGDWAPKHPEYVVKILPAGPKPGLADVVRLKVLEFMDPPSFRAALTGMLRLEFEKTPGNLRYRH